jgi:peptidoglycan/LPS O-acetylase OafA/YrhL
LAYITGLRGIAALLVALGHIAGMPPPDPATANFMSTTWLQRSIWPFVFGPQMVWLFLLISGFALYWSEMQRRDRGHSPTNLSTYAKRRVWRIAPTYYVAVAWGLVVLLLGRGVYLAPAETLNQSLPVTLPSFIAHMFFVQNLSVHWQYRINSPLWTLAFEVQLYFIFPLLVAKWRRASLVVGLAVIIANHVFLRFVHRPEFVLIDFFFIGVWAAQFLRTGRRINPSILTIAAVLGIAVPVLFMNVPANLEQSEIFWAIGFAALILRLFVAPSGGANFPTWRPTQWLGRASYSVYAMHFPIALAVWWLVGRFGWSRPAEVGAMLLIATPLVLAIAYVTYLYVEKPSLAKSQATRDAVAASVSQPNPTH